MSSDPIPWQHLRRVLISFAPVWLGSTLLFGLAGVGYLMVRQPWWAARQPLVLRDEATATEWLGRFASLTELKAAQETLLELAQNPEVVSAALRDIGPPDDRVSDGWPSQKTVEEVTAKGVNVTAPQGADFGNSEVVYLQVRGERRERALAFCLAMRNRLGEFFQQVRLARSVGVVEEWTQARDLAQSRLDQATERIRQIEIGLEGDLGELRGMNEMIAGEGANRRALELALNELQQAELEQERLSALHDLLTRGVADPQQLIVSGQELLASQPSLERLKSGLIDAQLQSSQLSGIYTADNPKLRAAIAREQEVRDRIRAEANSAIRAMEPSLRLGQQKVERLRDKADRLRQRLHRLAEIRSEYAQLEAEVRRRSEQLTQAEKSLADAEAARAAARSSSLLVDLGPPQVTDRPIGAPGSVLAGGAAAAGMIFGFGIVFLVAPNPNGMGFGRRRSDVIVATDRAAGGITIEGRRVAGRRAGDRLLPAPDAPRQNPAGGRRANDRQLNDRRLKEQPAKEQPAHEQPANAQQASRGQGGGDRRAGDDPASQGGAALQDRDE